MKVTDTFVRLSLDKVVVNRESRQRRELFDTKGQFHNSDGLLESIQLHGVLSPILVTSAYQLVFGERRYTASGLLGLPDIPIRFVEDLSPQEFQIVELTENLARSSLPWRDECLALAKLHILMKETNESWSLEDTERLTGGNNNVRHAMRVARDINSPRIADATSIRSAWNVLARLDDRATADALGDIIDGATSIFQPTAGADGGSPIIGSTESPRGASIPPGGTSGPTPTNTPPSPPTAATPDSILCLDFLQWAETYDGQPFNFIHCDFPYGIKAFSGPQSGRDKWRTEDSDVPYSDDPKVYTDLIGALCRNREKLFSYSAHLMFWLSADITVQSFTLEMFREWAPDLIFQTFPLVWHKTDNVGILPDPKRGPRRVFETCLVASREDRLILKSVSNCYGAPTNKEHHASTKPEPVLRYFMSMFVDENTRMLDPTCGSGSSLRAAESLGAKHVLGLERDPEHAKNATHALRQFRILRKVAK